MPIGPLIITINGMIRDFRPLLDYERKVDTSDLVPDGDYCLVEQLERAQYGVSMSHDAIIRKTVVTAIQTENGGNGDSDLQACRLSGAWRGNA